MEVEHIENPIKVNFIKSEIPIIFLDSNIIIEINKVLKNKCNSNYTDELKEIISLLKSKSKQNIIMVPYADQEDEVDYKKQDSNNIDFLFEISNGNQFKNHLLIQDEQKKRFFKAFLNNELSVNIDYQEGFNEINKQPGESHIFIKGLLNIFGNNTIKLLQDEKKRRTEKLQKYQQNLNKNETYKEHLVFELLYEFKKIDKIIKKIIDGNTLSNDELTFLNSITDYKEKDNTTRIINIAKFYSGFYWFAVPYVDIERNLYTYISLYEKFKPGDNKDIINASCYLPYCNYYFTDNSMCRILQELDIDKKYNVKIYSFKNIKEFLEELKKI